MTPPDYPEQVRPSSPAQIDTGWHLGLDVEAQVAPIRRRLLALLVDQVLAGVLVGGTVLLVPHGRVSPAVLIIPGLVALVLAASQWIVESLTGATVGSALLGIRTVAAHSARPAGLWAVLVRNVVQGLGSIVGGIGIYVVACSGAWDEGPGRRGWHDKAAGTLVLRAAYLSGQKDGAATERADSPVADPAASAQEAPSTSAVQGRSVVPDEASSGAVWVPAVLPSASDAGAGAHAVAPALDPMIPADTVPTIPPERHRTAPADLGELELTRLADSAGTTGLRLDFDTGEQVEITGAGLVGRSPSVGAHEMPPAHLIAIADPTQSVSRVHLAFRPVPGGLVVADCGSTNGTVLVDPAGYRWVLPGGQEAQVTAGWSVVLGERTMVIAQA